MPDQNQDTWVPKVPREKTWFILAGLLMVMLLSALDQTIVSTALPRIVIDLHGLAQYSWVATAYLLSSTVTVPLYGKLSDMFGRKPILMFGVVVFLVGSALCGMAQSMDWLIIARGFQGLGAGALMPVVIATMGDLFSPRERGRYQGITGAVWGLASIVGPALGGFITDHASWRFVFFVNLPVGIAAFAVLWLLMPKLASHEGAVKIDFVGSGLLLGGLGPLLLALTWAGGTYSWGSPEVLIPLAVSPLMLIAFLLHERRTPQPLLDLGLFRNPIVSVSTVVTALVGAAMFGGTFFIPVYAQLVLGKSATNSGNILTPLMITALLGSLVSGQLVSRLGKYKVNAVVGAVIMAAGAALLLRLNADSSMLDVIVAMVVMGLGMGGGMSLYTTIVQNAVPQTKIGQATGSVTLFRQLGGTVSLAVMGALMSQQALAMSGSSTGGHVSQASRLAFASGLHHVFLCVFAVTLLAMVLTVFLKEIPLRHRGVPTLPPAE